MKLNSPFMISSRLMPALQIGSAVIQLAYSGHLVSGKNCFAWTIDLDGEEFTGHGLYCFGNLQKGFEELIGWLYSAGESFNYNKRYNQLSPSDPLFPLPIAQWAAQHVNELSEMEETLKTDNLIEE